MKLSIRHLTKYTYDPEASKVGLRMKLFPAPFSAQAIREWAVEVNGDAVRPLHTEGSGDAVALWFADAPIESVEITARGVLDTTDCAGVLNGLTEFTRPGVYLRSTPATKANDALLELAGRIEGDDPLGRMHSLSELVHVVIDYRAGVTASETTAAEALALGSGVCQDQTHVFLAAARASGVPARYVVGYLDDPDAEVPPDQTHAWAEAHVKGLGWVGFDITNQLCPTDAYVRLCSGLDAADAAPIRGTVTGDTEEAMEVDIAVTREASQSQSQQ